MDTRYFGTNLLALNDVQDDHRRLGKECGEDAYYKQRAPEDRFFPKIAPFVVVVGFSLVTVGFWLQ